MLRIIRGLKPPQPPSPLEKVASVCLGHASVKMINDLLKLGSPKPAFWAPCTWAGGGEQLALGSNLGPPPAQAEMWCLLGFLLQGQHTGPCCLLLYAWGLSPTCWRACKTTRQPASSCPSLGSWEGGWEMCCKSPVTHARCHLVARAPRQLRLSLPMGVCRHHADPHKR